jgi:hypothetical protein
MARRWIPRVLTLVLIGAAVCWWRQRTGRVDPVATMAPTPSRQAAATTAPTTAPTASASPDWREPVDGGCPDGYPVKVARSGIFHEPGGRSYDRTVPERCYATAAQAEADGYRRTKA